MRAAYDVRIAEIRSSFESNGDGLQAAEARSALVDSLVMQFWHEQIIAHPNLAKGVAVCAIGGFGRAHLFPYSDIDLMFCFDKGAENLAKEPIRKVTQSLWDCGLQVSLVTRPPGECERLDLANPEFALALLDLRKICGDPEVFARLNDKSVPKLRSRDGKAIGVELSKLTSERHAKFGDTLFHLEPNIKDCPGGLRDANVRQWMLGLRTAKHQGGFLNLVATSPSGEEFQEAVAFLAAVRCFLHYRHERDDNTLDWQAQDAAAKARVGLGLGRNGVDAAYWMRTYFRHARVIEKCLLREAESVGLRVESATVARRIRVSDDAGFQIKAGVLDLKETSPGGIDAAYEPDIVLAAFRAVAESGARLSQRSEERIANAIPRLSSNLEEGPGLWQQLSAILVGQRAGQALRAMHALGVLELILPEFHGIDALVIRDAYHRYTVDEHTFVLIDTLHGLSAEPRNDARKEVEEWRVKFGAILAELQNPGLLYLAAVLHDTGKGRASEHHAVESARLAQGVLSRLEMDAYDSGVVIRLIETHLEMSAAMRRDIFDAETVRAFVGKVQTHESLRMLTLFTYADIAAVNPDALTPWKAENLWRLHIATANKLDRNVDEERVRTRVSGGALGGWRKDEKITRVLSLVPGREAAMEQFLEGFPERYVSTRSAETMRLHFELTQRFADDPFQMTFQHGPTQSGSTVSEITLVTQDRPRLFAGMAAALAAWGMNVVTADAFANQAGVVVDTFRFTDTFKTLELNESERDRFRSSVRDLVAGRIPVDKLLSGRRRAKRRPPRVAVDTKIDFDETASSHSTLLQVFAQDIPGLLRAISATLSELGYNVEVALVDTEGETAIDVFYLTTGGKRLSTDQEDELRHALAEAIEANSR